MVHTPTPPHWIVTTHHRMRSASFAYAFVFCGLHLSSGAYGAAYWVAITLQFLVYPHLLYWRARQSRNSLQAELENIQLDMLLWGVWAAALHFDEWICFTLFIASAINNVISMGRRGLLRAIGLYGLGLLLGVAVFGVEFRSDTSHLVTVMCVLGLSGYLLGIGHFSFQRTLSLRHVRENLRESESALQRANETLQARLNDIQQLQAQLQEQAHRDPLTGLYNRRYLESTIERELARCRREGQALTLMMLDVDHFKGINDRHGHAVGDEVLRRMGQLLQTQARQDDVACRFGGEEFVLLLPSMGAATALERAEQLRQAFEQVEVPSPHGGTVRTTVSVGISTYPEHGQAFDELVQRADQALYAVKHNGRNGVRLSAA